MRCLVAVALLGACYAPSPPSGAACTTACPGDEQCIAGICRAPGYVGDDAPLAIDAPRIDSDGDGVFDDVDNCVASANADQHDEDGDSLGDVCDPCPHVASGGTADSDSDGVGDACDPEPTNARQRLVVFDPFLTQDPAWRDISNTTFGTDAATMSTNGRMRYFRTGSELRVQFGGDLDVSQTASNNQLVLELSHDTTESYYYGEFFNNATGGQLKITRRDATMYATQAATNYSGRIPGGSFAWTFDVSVADQRLAFSARHGANALMPLAATPTMPPIIESDYVQIGAGGITARLDYFVIIETMK